MTKKDQLMQISRLIADELNVHEVRWSTIVYQVECPAIHQSEDLYLAVGEDNPPDLGISVGETIQADEQLS